MAELETCSILIELDALLDTRLALVASLGDSYLENVLKSDYHNRLIDDFEGIGFERFQELYNQRDRSILKEAIITPMGDLLKEFAFKTLKQIINTPYHYQPKIILNIYPYVLTEDEIKFIILGLIGTTNRMADIQIVSVSYEDITPSFVKKNVSAMILYEYYRWIEIHSANGKFKKVTCPEVTLLGPSIYFKPIISFDPRSFDAMQSLMEPLIGLRLLPIENFNIVLKKST